MTIPAHYDSHPAPALSERALAKAQNLLFEAIERGDEAEALRRLAQGANPNAFIDTQLHALDPARFTGKEGKTALMLAARKAHGALTRALLPLSDPLAVDRQGESALMHAARSGCLESASALAPLSDARQVNREGRDALMIACASVRGGANNPQLVELLISRCDASKTDEDGNDALMLAAQRSNMSSLAALIKACGSSRKNRFGETALIGALYRGKIAHIEELMAASDFPFLHADDASALFLAASAGVKGPALDFIQKQTRELQSSSLVTPLMAAAAAGRPATTAQLALSYDPQARDALGCDALMLAIEHHNPNTAMKLARMADLTARDVFGESALDKAKAIFSTEPRNAPDWEPLIDLLTIRLRSVTERDELSEQLSAAATPARRGRM